MLRKKENRSPERYINRNDAEAGAEEKPVNVLTV
jgi:hypothetical protein